MSLLVRCLCLWRWSRILSTSSSDSLRRRGAGRLLASRWIACFVMPWILSGSVTVWGAILGGVWSGKLVLFWGEVTCVRLVERDESGGRGDLGWIETLTPVLSYSLKLRFLVWSNVVKLEGKPHSLRKCIDWLECFVKCTCCIIN